MFAAHGIDPGRLELLGHSPHAELLGDIQRGSTWRWIRFPYQRHAYDLRGAVDGRAGDYLPRRDVCQPAIAQAASANVGLTETIARDLDEYVELAVSLAGDLPRLAALRAGLRQRMAASPLCDGKRFATNLMSMLHDVWEHLNK